MTAKEKILIVEDEFIVANDLRIILMKAGYSVCGIASSVEQARKMIASKSPDWILLDIMLKTETSGIELARELHGMQMPFLYISANTNLRTLEAAKQTQPYGFLIKPFRERDLLVMLDIARYRYGVEKERAATRPGEGHTAQAAAFEGIIGNSAALQKALHLLGAVAPTGTSVLLLGESGTGKERFAQAIHRASPRGNKPLVTVNCAALPLSLLESELFGHEKGAYTGALQRKAGKFELADGGTVFLDEVGELPPEAQVRLLRVLQEREVQRLGGEKTLKIDVRVVAATNRNLEKEVAEGRFRLDLYYRLNVFPVELPPLRRRTEDIPSLAAYFLERFSRQCGKPAPSIGEDAMRSLVEHDWPGNIRELEHVMERAVILAGGPVIETFDLPRKAEAPRKEGAALETMEEMERAHILKALKLCGGKVSGAGGAAEMLGLPAQTLYSKMKKLGISHAYR